jgi:hypothetical protein
MPGDVSDEVLEKSLVLIADPNDELCEAVLDRL